MVLDRHSRWNGACDPDRLGVVMKVGTEGLPSDLDVAADQSAWPLLRGERTWSSLQLLITLVTAGAATWCYIIGEYIGYYLDFRHGVVALVAGCLIGMAVVVVSSLPICIRFGIDSIAATRPQFGVRGWVLPSAMQFISILGWNSLLVIFFGKSAVQFLVAIHVVSDAAQVYLIPATTLLACGLVYLILLRGAGGVDRIAKILVAHVFVGLWMLYIIMSRRWDALVSAVPTYASSDHIWNMTTGIEIGISTSLSWWPYLGAMIRMTSSGRKASVPSILGLGMSVAVLSIIGVAGILVLQVSDPAKWLRVVGGPTYAVIALGFVTAANLGTTVTGIYCSAIGMRHFKPLENIRWSFLLLLMIAPVAIVGVFLPNLFFNNFGTFLAFIGVTFSPLCGIQITDYYALRRRNVSIQAIFSNSSQGAYWFWGGFNPAAFLAMLAGVLTYTYLLNPITYVSHFPYQYISASIPTLCMAGFVYWLLSILFVKPAGRGGYNSPDKGGRVL